MKLPSEAEWEKAARGGVAIPRTPRISDIERLAQHPTPRVVTIPNAEPRSYLPWSSHELTENDANCGNQVGYPSAVGIFPRNATVYGARDMVGNVWEWTRTIQGYGYPYLADAREQIDGVSDATPMQLRGGAWWSGECSCWGRYANFLYRADYGSGFRLVIAPS